MQIYRRLLLSIATPFHILPISDVTSERSMAQRVEGSRLCLWFLWMRCSVCQGLSKVHPRLCSCRIVS
ncbi:hypothetical protein BDN72DRAFT_358317 [Pluteus cervinus]|uniref:Uncharacterized protein n=1 Tax=Pluteus cervinus TaxID=181527 RepID=A0ACD3BDL5_9AGAR|nr:hypothetical protein BDN72DRAFT_358317 [Pluteus cervinus]